MQNLQPFIDSLQDFAQKRLKFRDPPKLFLKQDQENAKNVLGKTAFYDPNEKSITIFTTGRHPKDVLRSFAHELVHHCQNLRGDLTPEKCGDMGVGYAQQNDHLREMERQAYEQGNLCFRDWEDEIKIAMQQENKTKQKENKKMVKISKKELKELISKVLEVRVQENKKTETIKGAVIASEAEELEEAGCASHKRDEELEEAGCASHKRDEELEEGKDCCGMKGCPGPGKPHSGKYAIKESEELEEGEIPPQLKPHVKKKKPQKASAGKTSQDAPMSAPVDDEEKSSGKDGKMPMINEPEGKDLNKDGKEGHGKVPAFLKNESEIQTPEQEQKLYESRFNKRNEEIFDKLKKLWTK